MNESRDGANSKIERDFQEVEKMFKFAESARAPRFERFGNEMNAGVYAAVH